MRTVRKLLIADAKNTKKNKESIEKMRDQYGFGSNVELSVRYINIENLLKKEEEVAIQAIENLARNSDEIAFLGIDFIDKDETKQQFKKIITAVKEKLGIHS